MNDYKRVGQSWPGVENSSEATYYIHIGCALRKVFRAICLSPRACKHVESSRMRPPQS